MAHQTCNWRAHLLGDGQDFWFCYSSKYPAAETLPEHGQCCQKSAGMALSNELEHGIEMKWLSVILGLFWKDSCCIVILCTQVTMPHDCMAVFELRAHCI